jgi:pimeloyl-ACP methyl ester carboxylesterase
MGTIVASALAVERPELVSRLVLIDPVYGSERSALSAALDGVRAAPHEFATMAWGQFYGDRTPDWLPVWHRRRILSTDPQTVRDALVGLYEGEGAIGLKEVGVRYLPRRQAPILAIYAGSGAGVADWDSSLRHGAQDVIEVWPEHGHFLHQEDPDRFSRRVREWLEQLEPTVV